DAPMRFQVVPIASPPRSLTPDDSVPSARYQRTKNGYAVNESKDDLVVIKKVSNVFCSTYVAVSAPGAARDDTGYRLPPGQTDIFVAIGHQSSSNLHDQVISLAR